MSNPQVILYLAAFIVLIIGALDHPRFSAIRCICLALALVVLAQMPILH